MLERPSVSVPNVREYMTSYLVIYSNNVRILCCLWDKEILVEIANFSHLLRAILAEFCCDVWYEKTRMMGLADGEKSLMVYSGVVLTQSTRYRQTE